MRYRPSEIEATRPQRFYALRLVRAALELLPTSLSQVSSNRPDIRW
jgi:hypothetical protein